MYDVYTRLINNIGPFFTVTHSIIMTFMSGKMNIRTLFSYEDKSNNTL